MQIPVTFPTTAPEIAIPELDGKTAKMYRGGKICLSDHFKPLWGRNVPRFGIAHAMALGVSIFLKPFFIFYEADYIIGSHERTNLHLLTYPSFYNYVSVGAVACC